MVSPHVCLKKSLLVTNLIEKIIEKKGGFKGHIGLPPKYHFSFTRHIICLSF